MTFYRPRSRQSGVNPWRIRTPADRGRFFKWRRFPLPSPSLCTLHHRNATEFLGPSPCRRRHSGTFYCRRNDAPPSQLAKICFSTRQYACFGARFGSIRIFNDLRHFAAHLHNRNMGFSTLTAYDETLAVQVEPHCKGKNSRPGRLPGPRVHRSAAAPRRTCSGTPCRRWPEGWSYRSAGLCRPSVSKRCRTDRRSGRWGSRWC